MSDADVCTPRREDFDTIGAIGAAVVTIAAFAKSFVPFYLIGSTTIFVALSIFGSILIALRWHEIVARAGFAKDFILIAVLLYAYEVARYLVASPHQAPATYILGLLSLHALFLVFGFAAARYLAAIHAVLLLQGLTYLVVIAHFVITSGDVMRNGMLQDIFGINYTALYIALHQHIGTALSLALLAALGLEFRWARFATLIATPMALLFFFHIAARAALAALLASLLFRLCASLWVRSKRAVILSLCVVAIATPAASVSFYNFAIQDRNVEAAAPDAVSRTIRELQSDDPGFRLPIWKRAWHRVASDPRDLLFGRGIGSYSIDEGFGPPTWLLDKSPKHYPHNTPLEMLYETGVVGLILFGALIILPLLVSIGQWSLFGAQQKAAISIYVYYLATIQLSGAFAFDYPFQFFLAVAIGAIATTRGAIAGARSGSLRTSGVS
jgi:O-antigen ligase